MHIKHTVTINTYFLLFNIVIFTIHPVLLPKTYLLYDLICVASLLGCFFPKEEYASKTISYQEEEILLLRIGARKLYEYVKTSGC